MSNHLAKIFDVWDGNAEALATDIDELGVTVRQWRNRGDIPSRAWPKIIKAAAERDHVLRLEDFLRPEVVSELPPHAVSDKPEWPVASADNGGEIIGGEGEADSPAPFPEAAGSTRSSPTSSSTCPTCDAPVTPPAFPSSTGPQAVAEAAE